MFGVSPECIVCQIAFLIQLVSFCLATYEWKPLAAGSFDSSKQRLDAIHSILWCDEHSNKDVRMDFMLDLELVWITPHPISWRHWDFRRSGRDPVLVCSLFSNSITHHICPLPFLLFVCSAEYGKSSGIVIYICKNWPSVPQENANTKNPWDMSDRYLDILLWRLYCPNIVLGISSTNHIYIIISHSLYVPS